MNTLTQDEIDIMNHITRTPFVIMDEKLYNILANVCMKTGVNDAFALLQYWNDHDFQVSLLESGLLNISTGLVN